MAGGECDLAVCDSSGAGAWSFVGLHRLAGSLATQGLAGFSDGSAFHSCGVAFGDVRFRF